MKFRERVYQTIEPAGENDIISKVYEGFMMIVIIVSLIPIAAKSSYGVMAVIDTVTVVIFIIDYLLRLVTSDLKLHKKTLSFLMYPFTPMAIIDLFAILPSVLAISNSFRLLKIIRLLRTLRVLRAFKAIRYSKSISIILNVFKKQKEPLLVVCGLAVGYILITALVIISIEPDTFNTFFDAIYWATVSLTTVGYGDIYAVSVAGKIITMISSVFGIAIVALPAGIVTAGYLEELQSNKENDEIEKDEHSI